MRLTVNKQAQKRGELDDSHEIEFTKQRNRQNEWYFQVETFGADKDVTTRIVNFKHVLTGQYLCATKDGKVVTQDSPNASTSWLLEPVVSTRQLKRQSSGSPTSVINKRMNDIEPSSTTFYSLHPKAFAALKLALTTKKVEQGGGLDLIATETREAAIFELEFTSGELCFISNPVTHTQIR